MKLSGAVALGAFGLAVLGAAPAMAGSYEFHLLKFPGAKQTIPSQINSSGTVVGSITDSAGLSHGFVWSAGVFTQVDAGVSSGTVLTGLNDRGVAIGIDGALQLFTYNLATKAIVFVPYAPGPDLGYTNTYINDAGAIAGSAFVARTPVFSFYGNASGLHTLKRPFGASFSEIKGLSNHGLMAGITSSQTNVIGFTFKSGVYTHVIPPSSTNSDVFTVTGAGEVIGTIYDGNGQTIAFTQTNGKFTFYQYPNTTQTVVTGATLDGSVVGEFLSAKGLRQPFVFSGGVYHHLSTPWGDKMSVQIASVNRSGSFVGNYAEPRYLFIFPFIGVCRRDQIPCTQ